ncbi:hypothetical protein [Dawidia cretensis]|nr:hypothetical protein [Dawidia cretensis]
MKLFLSEAMCFVMTILFPSSGGVALQVNVDPSIIMSSFII